MRILVVGSGGREHALIWKMKQNMLVEKIYCAPGNGGIADMAECVDIEVTDLKGLAQFSRKQQIDLTVVGPELPLTLGIADVFKEKGLPLVGDDIQDQLGSTILHRSILQLLVARGVRVDKSYQLDVGGGAESLDSHYRGRMRKRGVKTTAISQDLPYEAPLVAGSSDYVPFLDNGRESYFYVHGRQFGGAPVVIDVRMEVTDGPNAGPILMDVIRGTKLALKREISGSLEAISAYGFKKAPVSLPYYKAERWVEEFLLGKRKQ